MDASQVEENKAEAHLGTNESGEANEKGCTIWSKFYSWNARLIFVATATVSICIVASVTVVCVFHYKSNNGVTEHRTNIIRKNLNPESVGQVDIQTLLHNEPDLHADNKSHQAVIKSVVDFRHVKAGLHQELDVQFLTDPPANISMDLITVETISISGSISCYWLQFLLKTSRALQKLHFNMNKCCSNQICLEKNMAFSHVEKLEFSDLRGSTKNPKAELFQVLRFPSVTEVTVRRANLCDSNCDRFISFLQNNNGSLRKLSLVNCYICKSCGMFRENLEGVKLEIFDREKYPI